MENQNMEWAEAFRSEIQFWDEMLSLQTAQTDPDVLQRMQMAKRLAERKLELFFAEHGESVN